MTTPEDTGSAQIPSVPKRRVASSKPWRALEWLSLAAAISCSVAAGVALHSAVFEPIFVPSPARLMAYELERLGQRVDPVQRGLTSPSLPSSERASGALSGTDSLPGAAIASNQEAVPETALEPRSPPRNAAMVPHVGSQDAVDLRSELEIVPHGGRPARAASAQQSRVAGPKSLEPGASAPFAPADVTTLVPVTVVARPAGEILYRKQVIGRDRVTLHVPTGRRCFRGRRLAVERRLCPEVVLGQHNQVLLDLRDSVAR